mmetsp:Transcript_32819/g.50122  ORF Transcript_32819/g.50122 Transcript_32819/m.50122 type:complete len:117 (+) Transcript_32819:5119-5469(+)
MILCTIKSWVPGVRLLLSKFQVAFAKLPILDKFEYVLNLFKILHNYSNQAGTMTCLELIIGVEKVIHYIQWQEKNPQHMIVLKIYVRQMFSEEAQVFIKQSQDQNNAISMQRKEMG